MEGTLQNIAITELGDTVGTPPSLRLQESVERVGILQPLLLAERITEAGEIGLVVVDGNRRLAAARRARLTHVSAVVLTGLSLDDIAGVTLATNSFRSTNYLTEFWAMKQLERSNFTPDEIRSISGMSGSSIDLRNLLLNLNRELFVALRFSRIHQAEAISASKLHKGQQDVLEQHYRETGRLTRSDILELFPDLPRKTTTHDGEGKCVQSQSFQPSLDVLQAQLIDSILTAKAIDQNKEAFLALASHLWDVTSK